MSIFSKDFYESNKYTILWTVGYVAAVWAIMRYMFNFNIFSALRWHQLFHSHLHGFAGMVFGILILAMVPLYLATTILVARTKAPLVSVPIKIDIPKILKDAFVQPPMPESAPKPEVPITEPESAVADTPETAQPIAEPQPEPVPETVPAELQIAYARARENVSRNQTSAFDLGNVTNAAPNNQTPEPQPEPEPEMPIPTDFDISDTENIIGDAPVFTNINFDDLDEDLDEELTTPETTGVKEETDTGDIVTKYLAAKSVPYTTEGEVIITKDFAIVSHTDSDFWVADNESWFAAGKIRKSPIASVLTAAANANVQPVLYLGADNIMDIDELRKQWEKSGIRVITDLTELG